MTPTGETRAEIARQRLAQLAAAFDEQLPPDDPPPPPPPVATAARPTVTAPHVRVVAAGAVAAAVLLVWWLLAQRPDAGTPVAPVGLSSSGAPAKQGPAELVVDVVGDVKRPGIVTVPRGSRVHEAIAAAGGLKGKVDTSSINLARRLEDGEQIVVGAPAAATVGGGAEPGAAPGGKLNLNTATEEQLDELPGVGPVTAKSILDWRQENGRFGSVDDLLDVKGIGDATLADLRDRVTV